MIRGRKQFIEEIKTEIMDADITDADLEFLSLLLTQINGLRYAQTCKNDPMTGSKKFWLGKVKKWGTEVRKTLRSFEI